MAANILQDGEMEWTHHNLRKNNTCYNHQENKKAERERERERGIIKGERQTNSVRGVCVCIK